MLKMPTFVGVVLSLSVVGFAQDPGVPPGCVLVDDMVVPEEMAHGESGYSGTAWPNGVVPYDFAAGVSSLNRERTRTALAELMAVANVRFVPRTTETAWITFQNSTGNNSYLGMSGGNQVINLVNWDYRYIICHEVMHALGFVHEHQRPDRDTYVTINWANISTGAAPQFGLSAATTPNAYDFLSIMHYSAGAFSSGGPSISCNAGYTQFQNQIGNLSYLPSGDAQGLVSRYGPPPAPRILSLSQTSAPVGTASLLLTVTGERFTAGDSNPLGTPRTRILWNGTPLTTNYVPATGQITATIAAGQLQTATCATIAVENPFPGGGISAPVPFAVGPTSCPSLVEFSLNSSAASLTIDGQNLGSAYGPALVVRKVPLAPTSLIFQTTAPGSLADTAIVLALPVPASAGGAVTPGLQAINLDLASPGLVFLQGGAFGPALLPTGPWTLGFAAPPPPIVLTAQTMVVDASLADGFRLTQAAALEVPIFDPCQSGTSLMLSDDSFVQQPLGFAFPWYGTFFSQIFVGSNGYVTFLTGSSQKNPTALGLRSLPPAIAPLYGDLDPGSGGTVRFLTDQSSRFGLCFTGVPAAGTALPVSFSVIADAGLRISTNYGSVASVPFVVGLAPGFGSGVLFPLNLSAGPHAIPGGSVPYEVFAPGAFDLGGASVVWTLSPTGVPTGAQ
jgi:hypothetical protein